MSYKKNFINFMVESGVLTFGDFTTKSGRKTPYFINTGNYKTGEQIARLGEFYAECIMTEIENGNISPDTKTLFGPAYKGIPLVVATSIGLSNKFNKNINYTFNRKEEKDHGEGGSLVGYKFQKGDKVIIVEDVITAGTAIREVLPILTGAGVEIEGLIVSVNRMERGQNNITAIQEIEKEFGIKTFPLISVLDIIEHADISTEMVERIKAYLAEYGA